MGDAHFIEEQGTGDVLGSLYFEPIPRKGDEIELELAAGKAFTRFRVDAIVWRVRDDRAWATLIVERVE